MINKYIISMIIYKATNKKNSKCYIGQTILTLNRRIQLHLNCKSKKNYFTNYLKKHFEDFKWTILEICMSIEEMNEKEIWYINHFDSTNKEKGYNILKGGKNHIGFKHSEEEKKKISERMKGNQIWKGRKHTSESKNKVSSAKIGHVVSDETKLKISLTKVGFKMSEESKLKMKESGKKAWEKRKKKL